MVAAATMGDEEKAGLSENKTPPPNSQEET